MEHSIATSQANAIPAELRGAHWKSFLAGICSALRTAKLKIMSSPWLLRHPLDSDIASNMVVDRIANRLAVEKRGRSEGRNERPATTEEVVAGAQTEIIHYFKQMRRKAHRQVAQMTAKLHAVGEHIDVADAVGYLRDIPPRCQNEVLRINADFQSRLDFLREQEAQERSHYETFREANKLSRIARYPASPIIVATLVAVLTGIAALTLGKFLLPGAESHVPVTNWQAISISLLAVIFPFVVGSSIFRSVNHVDAVKELTGWLAGLMTIVFIGGLALFCAFYIAGMTTNPDASLRDVIDAILADPTAASLHAGAWRGFGIVTVVGLLAFMLGYRSDDPYPGYGAVQRTYYRAREAREFRANRLRRRINKIVDAADGQVAEVSSRMKARLKQFSALGEKLQCMQTQLRDFEAALEDSCNIVLDRYRVANESVRKTGVPLSFSEHICFRSEDEPTYAGGRNRELQLRDFDGSMTEFEAEVAKVRQKLRDLNSRTINDLDGALWQGDNP